MKQIICILFICLVAVLIIGCKAEEKEAEPSTTAAEDVSSVEQDLSDIESLDEELDMSELDNLEQELEEIEW